MELLMEFLLHLGCPLCHQTSRANNKNTLDEASGLQLFDDHASLDCFTKTNFICKNVSDRVPLHYPIQHMELMRQRNNSACKGGEKASRSLILDLGKQSYIPKIVLIVCVGAAFDIQLFFGYLIHRSSGRIKNTVGSEPPCFNTLQHLYISTCRCIKGEITNLQHVQLLLQHGLLRDSLQLAWVIDPYELNHYFCGFS